MDPHNAFKTSLLFLGIIFIVIILRGFLVSDAMFGSSEKGFEQGAHSLCGLYGKNC